MGSIERIVGHAGMAIVFSVHQRDLYTRHLSAIEVQIELDEGPARKGIERKITLRLSGCDGNETVWYLEAWVTMLLFPYWEISC